jgi:hypothetical protein
MKTTTLSEISIDDIKSQYQPGNGRHCLDDNHDPESGCIAMADVFDSFSQPALAAQARLAEEPEHVTDLATEARRMAHLFNQWESVNDLLGKYGI